jgi:hypothetical protein
MPDTRFSGSGRSGERLGHIIARSLLGSPFVVVGKRLKLSRNRNHRLDKPKLTGRGRHTGGILSGLKQFDAERHYSWIIGCPPEESSEWL